MADRTYLLRNEIAKLIGSDPKLIRAYEELQRAALEQLPELIEDAQLSLESLDARVDIVEDALSEGATMLQDEGAAQDFFHTVNFVGNGVSGAVAAGVATITINSAADLLAVLGGDPNADRILFWDDSAGAFKFLTVGTNLTISGTTLDASAGGSSTWALAGSGQTATGVYDFAVDGAKANIDFTGLGSFNELLVLGRGLTNGTSGTRQVQVSVDNGANFFTTSGNYVTIGADGAANNAAGIAHSTASTAARNIIAHILNMKGTEKLIDMHNGTGIRTLFVASSSDINAVRVTNGGGGNMTAGTVRVYAR